MIVVRDVRRHYQITQVPKKEIGEKNEKIIGDCIFTSSSDSIVFWFCRLAKFKCQPLVTDSGRFVPLFHSRESFEKRLQG